MIRALLRAAASALMNTCPQDLRSLSTSTTFFVWLAGAGGFTFRTTTVYNLRPTVFENGKLEIARPLDAGIIRWPRNLITTCKDLYFLTLSARPPSQRHWKMHLWIGNIFKYDGKSVERAVSSWWPKGVFRGQWGICCADQLAIYSGTWSQCLRWECWYPRQWSAMKTFVEGINSYLPICGHTFGSTRNFLTRVGVNLWIQDAGRPRLKNLYRQGSSASSRGRKSWGDMVLHFG